MQEKVKSIVYMFPDYEDRIEYLFINDANFREICTDYIVCASKILNMNPDNAEFNEQIKEYEEVQRNLEQDILDMITFKKNSKP